MKKRTIAAALLCVSLAGPTLAAGDATAGKGKAAACAACHGADGKALIPNYPNLAGQHASYIAKQLTEYKDGTRANAIMAGMAVALSDQDILDLAAYFASLPAVAGVASEENLEAGENIYRGGITSAEIPACTSCHGPSGQGNMAAAWPAVGGQNVAYIAEQLRYFRTGTQQ